MLTGKWHSLTSRFSSPAVAWVTALWVKAYIATCYLWVGWSRYLCGQCQPMLTAQESVCYQEVDKVRDILVGDPVASHFTQTSPRFLNRVVLLIMICIYYTLICYRTCFFVLETVEIVCVAISFGSNHKMTGLLLGWMYALARDCLWGWRVGLPSSSFMQYCMA